MAGYPPPYPPPIPPPGYDPRDQRRFARAQARAQRDAYRAQREQAHYRMRAMRRGSVLGPLLLIAVGILFLLMQSGRLDHSHFWAWYGRWWPFLLVAAGAVVLVEWAIDQYLMRDPQRPPYRRSLGGGAFLLIVLLGAAGIAAGHSFLYHLNGEPRVPGFTFDQNSLDELFGDKHESDQTLDFAFAPGSSLDVVNPRGDVTVSGTSDDDLIHIAIHKQVWARTDAEADAKARQLVPTPQSNADGGPLLRMPSLDGARADLVISVPAAAEITVTANRGDVHVSSIKATVRVTANGGDIELSAITGTVNAHINSSRASLEARNLGGGIAIQGHAQDLTVADVAGPVTIAGEFFGTTHLEHIDGTIHFHTSRTDLRFARLDGETEISSSNITADQALGPAVLTTSNRNVSLDRIAGEIAVTNRNGAIDLTAAPALGNITVEDRNGPVTMTMPEKAGFSVDARTTNGAIDTDFQLETGGGGNAKTLTGTVGGGGPLVRIATANSDVSIRKGDVQAVPAEAPAPVKITIAPQPPAAAELRHRHVLHRPARERLQAGDHAM